MKMLLRSKKRANQYWYLDATERSKEKSYRVNTEQFNLCAQYNKQNNGIYYKQ